MGTKWDRMQPGEVRDTNSKEYVFLQQLYVLDARMQESDAVIKNRIAAVKNGWRDWKCAMTLIRNVLVGILETMPDKRQKQLCAIQKQCRITIDQNPYCLHEHPLGMNLVSMDDLNIIANYACQHECNLCLKEGAEINRCELRQALMQVAPPKLNCAVGCEYRRMVETLVDMEEEP